MEISRLQPESQAIVNQFARFRNEYSTLKTHNAAQEEIIKLQKLEAEQMRSGVEQLTSTLMMYRKRFKTTVTNLELENKRLQKTIDNLRREHENTRVDENQYIQEVHRTNEEYSHRLEEQLKESRQKIAAQNKKHEEHVKSIEDRHSEEISKYIARVEGLNSRANRLSDEISGYKTKIEQLTFTEKRQREEILACKNELEQIKSLQGRHCEETTVTEKPFVRANKTVQECGAFNKRNSSHPALDEGIGSKRKKLAMLSHRWQPLDFTVENDIKPQIHRKKKLYQADNEAIVDLEP